MAGTFRQLFDGPEPGGGGSSTYTYILADESGQALIIDPVLEHVDRDLGAVSAAGLNLALALNTHCHADHITGTGELKRRVPGLRSAIAKAAGARADVLLEEGEKVLFGGRCLQVLATPGHTDGCLSFYDPALGAVFTGDALLIGGCGRTDFQGGSAETLFRSVHEKLFSLPPETVVYPAHDYKGQTSSTIGAEKATNPRLTQSLPDFVKTMARLGLPYPKKIDASLPANLMCGAI